MPSELFARNGNFEERMKKVNIKKTSDGIFSKIGKTKFGKLVGRHKAIFIAIAILIVLLFGLVAWSGGCTSYVYNSEKFSDAVGTWKLDCIYVDTKPIAFNPTKLAISGSKKATKTETVTVTPEVTNADGSVTAAVTEDQTTEYTLEASKGTLTLKASDGTSTEYTFSVDVDAQLLHLYTTIDGHIYHSIYLLQQ